MAPKKKIAHREEDDSDGEENLLMLKKRKKSTKTSGGDEDEEEDDEEDEDDEDEDEDKAAADESDLGSSSSSDDDSDKSSDEEEAAEEDEEEEDEDEDEDEDDEAAEDSDDDEGDNNKKKKKKRGKKRAAAAAAAGKGDDVESVGSFDAYQRIWTAEDDGDDELEPEEMEQRLENKYRRVQEVRGRSIVHMHPELTPVSHEEMMALTRVVRNERGEVADPLHRRSAALLSKYEFTAVTSKRAEQLDRDDDPLVQDLPPGMVSSIAIAHYEFQKGALNDIFIIQRPFPDGSSEYWRLGDLEYV